MTAERARAVLAMIEHGQDWAAECLCEGQGDIGLRAVRLLAQGRHTEVVAELQAVIAAEEAAA